MADVSKKPAETTEPAPLSSIPKEVVEQVVDQAAARVLDSVADRLKSLEAQLAKSIAKAGRVDAQVDGPMFETSTPRPGEVGHTKPRDPDYVHILVERFPQSWNLGDPVSMLRGSTMGWEIWEELPGGLRVWMRCRKSVYDAAMERVRSESASRRRAPQGQGLQDIERDQEAIPLSNLAAILAASEDTGGASDVDAIQQALSQAIVGGLR